jgi:hypothetical protein
LIHEAFFEIRVTSAVLFSDYGLKVVTRERYPVDAYGGLEG